MNLISSKYIGLGVLSLSTLLLTGCGNIQTKDTSPQNIHTVKHINKNNLQLKKASIKTIRKVSPQKSPVRKVTKAERAAWVAQKQLNIPYVWGGTKPSSGFDCSGLVQYSYKVNKLTLPRTASEQYASTRRIPTNQARKGDLVFFKNTGKRRGITHVGIYLGNGKFIHAPRKGKTVEISTVGSAFWRKHLAGFGRVNRSLMTSG